MIRRRQRGTRQISTRRRQMQLSSNGYQTSEAENENDCISYAKQESINDCFQIHPSCSYLLFNLGSSPPRSQLHSSTHESHHRACEFQKPSLDLSNRLVFPVHCCAVRRSRRHYQKNHVSLFVAATTTTVLLGNHPPSPSFFFFSPELPTPTVQHGEGVFWENRKESKEKEEKEREGRRRRRRVRRKRTYC